LSRITSNGPFALTFALIVAGCSNGDIGSGTDETDSELGDDGSAQRIGDGSDGSGAENGGGNGNGNGGAGSGAGNTGGGNTGGSGGAPTAIDCTHEGAGIDYQVGPGKAYESIGDVPFESLAAGDTVRIFWREAHYHEKMMIGGVGTADQPIRVCGVAGPDGQLPVIDGENATTRSSLQFPYDGHQRRGLVIIGHEHDAPYSEQTSHVVLEGLEITNASPENSYTAKNGEPDTYINTAAGVFLQRGDDITVRGCIVHDNNNGLFMGTGGGTDLSNRVLIEGNYIHSNGSLTDYYHHNVYNEVSGVTYQFNRFGEPRAGAGGEVLGANIKERSAGVTIRYNWIEDGAHLIDLVDAQEAADTTLPMPSFHQSFVYGNVMTRTGTQKGSMIHYGGDSGIYEHYRKGSLFFYENTLVVKNEGAAEYDAPAVFEVSTNDEAIHVSNNIFWSSTAPGPLAPIVFMGKRDGNTSGVATFEGNWVQNGWTSHNLLNPGNLVAQVTGLTSSMFGNAPGFSDAAAGDYSLSSGAPVVGAGVVASMSNAPAVEFEYVMHQNGKPRAKELPPTIGAMTVK
jgi:hypothetical protein